MRWIKSYLGTSYRLAGYACLAAWVSLLYSSNVLLLSPGELMPLSITHLFSSFAAGTAGLIIALLATRLSPLHLQREVLHLTGIIGAVASCGIAFVSAGVIAPEWILLCVALTGFSGTFLLISWIEQFAVDDARQAIIAFALATILGYLLGLLIILLPQSVGITITVLLPICATFTLRPAKTTLTPSNDTAGAPRRPSYQELLAKTPLRFILIVGIVSFAMGALQTLQLPNDPALTPLDTWIFGLITSLVAMVLASVLAFLSFRINVSIAFYVAIPVIALASLLLALPYELPGTLLLAISSSGVSLINFLVWLLLVDAIIKGKISAAWSFGLLTAVQFAGTLLGQLLTIFSGGQNLVIAFAVLLVLIIATLATLGSRPQVQRDAIGNATTDIDEQGHLLAAATGLSPREEEILLIWITGHNSAYIEGKLHISKNTVKTHLSHIYSKTNCTNREELLARLDEQ